MPPASCPLFCRSCTRATLEMAGTARARSPAAIASAMPISISVMPRARTLLLRSLRRGGGDALAAVHGDVVAAALRLVGPVRVHVVAVPGLEVLVVHLPGVLVDLPHVLGHQLLQAVGPGPGLDVIKVHAVG